MVLIVDDEPLVARSVARYLECCGYCTETCGDGREAVEKLTRKPFRLVLTDMNLPDGGYEHLLDHIEREKCKCQVIVMRGQNLAARKETSKRRTRIQYLQKPFDLDVLLERVQEIA